MRPQPSLSNLDAMVAVAAGTTTSVGRWAAVLAKAGIPSAVARCCESGPFSPDYAELWVLRRDADDAHAALWGVWPSGQPTRARHRK